jgi:uncharacterized phage protein gp47/JayE
LAVSTQTFTQYVSNAVAAIQSAASALLDLTVGSVLLAAVQAQAAIALWLQGIALQVAALTRFATSNGPDADSWGADFGFTRIAALFATGQVTFSRFTPTNQATIAAATVSGTNAQGLPIYAGGSLTQTADGAQAFQVIPDATQTAFNAALNAYVIPAGTASAVVTVQSVNAAAAANAGAGSITILAQSIPFIDTVSNVAAMTGGADAEKDAAYKARFPQFLASLSAGTKAAISFAIRSLGVAVNFTITENQTLSGVLQPGFFFVIADNGTGSPPAIFLSSVAAAIEAVRGETITYAVFAPTLVVANIVMPITTAAGFMRSSVVAAVIAALTAQINALPIGADLPYTLLASIAYSVPGVATVPTGYTLNGATADLVTTSSQIIKASAITVL